MNAIDIFTQEGATLESGSSFLGGQKEEKTALSLFDTILKSSIDTKGQTNIALESNSLNGTKVVANSMENINVIPSTTSLLDKMLLEAKELISKDTVQDTATLDIKKDVDGSLKFIDSLKDAILEENSETISKNDIKSEIKDVVKQDIKPNVNNVNLETKPETITSNSLLDKLLSEVKKDINSSLIPENTNLEENSETISKNDIKSEIKDVIKQDVKPNVNNVNLETKPETITSNSLLDKLLSEVKKDILVKDETIVEPSLNIITLENSENTEILVTPIDKNIENKPKMENSPTALLDRLISDAKNKIVEDKNSLKEQKITQTPQITVEIENQEVVLDTVTKDNLAGDEDSNIIKNQTPQVNNEKVVISNIKPIEILDSKVKETLEQVVEQKPKSLMDALIQNSVKKQEEFASKNIDLLQTNSKANEVVSNIYLSEQKNQLNTQLNFNKTEALKLLKDGASLEDIQKSATILDLDANDVDVEKTHSLDELVKKNNQRDLNDKKIILDSLLNEKNVRSIDVRNLITKSVEASAALLENSLNIEEDKIVNVNSPLAFNIHSKIIGARQQMTNMMSDIARQMYENYKPPVTVFRINLHPEHLGSIAIMMKTERNSDVSISMSVASQATLEALMENQNLLRNSLNKTFDENTKFNLDFNSGEKNQDGNQRQKQEEQKNQDEHIDTQTILKLQEENKDIDDKFDYM